MMPEATVLNARQEQSHGTSESTGRDWTRTDLFDGNGEKYGTFNDKHAAVILATAGKKVDIAWDVKGKHKNLTSVAEHIEAKKSGGSGYDDPVRQHRITVLACMKVAAEIANHAADQFEEPVDSQVRLRSVKSLAADLAVWVDEYAERAANPPFEDDGIPFGEPDPQLDEAFGRG